MRFQPGQLIAGRYRIDFLIGQGAGAEVYKVWDVKRSTHLALKLLREELSFDKGLLQKFQDEARALAQLMHPGIIRFYELVQEKDLIFFLMDFVDGKTLKHILSESRRPFDLERILSILRPLCESLQYAHQLGITHCDIKPGNILLDKNGKIYLTDFGIAMNQRSRSDLEGPAGTPPYMAPEQIESRQGIPQTDIYALGVILFEMLVGRRPFRGDTAPAYVPTSEKIKWEHLNCPAPVPSQLNPNLQEGMDAIILKCLEKDPRKRYLNCLELADELEKLKYISVKKAPDPVVKNTETAPPTPQPRINIPVNGRLGIFLLLPTIVMVLILVLALGANNRGGGTPPSLPDQNYPVTHSYPNACMEIVTDQTSRTIVYECVTSITAMEDGTLKVNVEWKVGSLWAQNSVKIYSDAENHNLFLRDNLGNRLDHISSGGGTEQEATLFNGDKKQGWFIFPAPDPAATGLYFVDGDNNVQTPQLDRFW